MLTGNFTSDVRPIHCPRPGVRASKKRTRASAHIKWLFSTKQVVSPVLTSATGAAFLVCARKQRRSAFARPHSHRQRLSPVIHTLCSRGDNQETVQPRKSVRYRRKEPERRPASFPRTEKPRVWALESHVTDNLTLQGQWEAFIHVGCLGTSNKSVAVPSIRACSAHAALSGHCNMYLLCIYTHVCTYYGKVSHSVPVFRLQYKRANYILPLVTLLLCPVLPICVNTICVALLYYRIHFNGVQKVDCVPVLLH